jgi:hypothetical protein
VRKEGKEAIVRLTAREIAKRLGLRAGQVHYMVRRKGVSPVDFVKTGDKGRMAAVYEFNDDGTFSTFDDGRKCRRWVTVDEAAALMKVGSGKAGNILRLMDVPNRVDRSFGRGRRRLWQMPPEPMALRRKYEARRAAEGCDDWAARIPDPHIRLKVLDERANRKLVGSRVRVVAKEDGVAVEGTLEFCNMCVVRVRDLGGKLHEMRGAECRVMAAE